MDLFKAMEISASSLDVQRLKINVISMNMANVNTTRTEGGGPYTRKRVVFSAIPFDPPFVEMLSNRIVAGDHLKMTHPNHFSRVELLSGRTDPGKGGVRAEILEDGNGSKEVYDPAHPDADEYGNVQFPNVNPIEEMVDLMGAVRSYEANVTAFNAAKSMALKALEIGR